MKRTDRRSDCPINYALQIFGDGWSLLIIRDLMFKEARTYTDFLTAGEGVATNVLAARLRELRESGLIEKRGSGKGAEYALTAKGLDLLPMMLELIAWSAQYDEHTAAAPEFVARLREDRVAFTAELRNDLTHQTDPERRET